MTRDHRRSSLRGAVVLLVTAVALIAVASSAEADGNEAPSAPPGARSITAGGSHTCAILDDATVKCWGSGSNGQLGQDSNETLGDQAGEMANLAPVNLGPDRTAKAITAGNQHTCALLDNNTLKCWGSGANGRLGQGSIATIGDQAGEMAALPPVNLGPGRTAKAITAGESHTCAVLDNARVKCWGNGGFGRLGQDSNETLGDQPGDVANLNPVNLGTGRTATAITAGAIHTCALLDNARVKCWGGNFDGQLGQDSDDTIGDQAGEMANLAPVNLGPDRTAKAITAGNTHTCALLDNNTVKCWGSGANGQLGQGSIATIGDQAGEMAALAPVNLGPDRTAKAISAGESHTCALLDNNTVKCWGFGNSGRLGQDSAISIGATPGDIAALPPVNLGTGSAAVTTGAIHTCALLDDATLKCWGNGAFGRLGQDSSANRGDQFGGMAGLGPINVGDGRTVGLPVRRPDAHIRLGGGAFAGNDIYNTTGAQQTRTTTVRARGTATFTVRIQNDGNTNDTFDVKGLGSTNRYAVTYRDGPTNVTAAVVDGTFTTDDLDPDATQSLTLTIRAKPGTPVGNRINRLTTITSTNQSTPKDAVKATVTRRR